MLIFFEMSFKSVINLFNNNLKLKLYHTHTYIPSTYDSAWYIVGTHPI